MREVSPSPRSSRLPSLDLLRGVAALAVVCHHALNYGQSTNLPVHVPWFRWLYAVVDRGELGVPLFFVISGFCIHLRWARQYRDTGSFGVGFGAFWRRRIHRLYPPYFVMLCLSMALVVAAWLARRDVPLVAHYPEPRGSWMALDFGVHALMLHGFHPRFDLAGGNPPFWTLAREEYFYAMYFLLLAWRRRWGPFVAGGIAVGLGLAFPALLRPLMRPTSEVEGWWLIVRTSALTLWAPWVLGMIAVEAYLGLIRLPRWCSLGRLIPAWAVLALWSENGFALPALATRAAAGATASWETGGIHWCVHGVPGVAPALWGLTFFALVNWCVKLERQRRWPDHPVVAWLTRVGVFSYSLYLVHVPVRAVLKQLLGPLAATTSVWGYLLVAAAVTVAGYFAGKVFFLLVERRFLNTPVSPGASASGA